MDDTGAIHRYTYRVSFGDCDPAGIVYYPNIYRWVDAAFHDYLHGFGGHTAICGQLGAIGVGLMETSARYRRPLRNGDRIDVVLAGMTWAARAVTLTYRVETGGALAVEATEVRGVFQPRDGTIAAGATGPLRALLETG